MDRFEVAESFNRVCMAIEELIACSPGSFADSFERLNEETLRSWPNEGIQVSEMHTPTIEFQELFKAWLFDCRGLSRTKIQSEARVWIDRFDEHLQTHQINVALGNCFQSKLMRRLPLVGGEIGCQSAPSQDFERIQSNSHESPTNQANTGKSQEIATIPPSQNTVVFGTKQEIANAFKQCNGNHPNADHVARILRTAKCPFESANCHSNSRKRYPVNEALSIIEKKKPDWQLIDKE